MQNETNDLLVLTVTFNPNLDRLFLQIDAVSRCAGFHIIVDNNSVNILELENKLQSFIEKKKLQILKLSSNFGIAHAINEGITYAFTRKEQYILMLDHDSLPSIEMIEQLQLDYNKLIAKGIKVAGIGPLIIDDRAGDSKTPLKIVEARNHKITCVLKNITPVEHIITSGSLYDKSIFKEIGLMKESFFIDFVDIEWCLRAKSKGYISFISKSAILKHQLGDKIINVIFNKKIHIHSPIRNYYFFRNLIRMLKLNYIPLAVRLRMLKQCCKIFLSILLFAPRKT